MNETQQPNYYAVIPVKILHAKGISAQAKLLYCEISSLSNKEGYCWASNEYFARLYECDSRTIKRWLNELKINDFINCDYEYKDGTKEIERRYISIAYRGGDKNDTTPGTNISHTPGQICHHPQDKNVPDNNINVNNINANNTSLTAGGPAGIVEDLIADVISKIGIITQKQEAELISWTSKVDASLIRYAAAEAQERGKYKYKYMIGIIRGQHEAGRSYGPPEYYKDEDGPGRTEPQKSTAPAAERIKKVMELGA